MFDYFSKFWFDFVFVMTLKEIKSRYKRALLGFLWVLLNPLLQMLVIGFVFQFFIPMEIDNYFYFLFSGLLPWNFFSHTITKCTTIILDERSLLQKAKFPREALTLAIIFSNFFHFFISLVLLIFVALFINWTMLTKIFILFGALFWLILFVIGMSFLLGTLYVKYRDLKFIVSAIIPLVFYATPVIYSRSLLPDWVSNLLMLNPMTGIIELFHFVFIRGSLLDYKATLYGFSLSVILFVFGIHLFRKDSPYFDDWL